MCPGESAELHAFIENSFNRRMSIKAAAIQHLRTGHVRNEAGISQPWSIAKAEPTCARVIREHLLNDARRGIEPVLKPLHFAALVHVKFLFQIIPHARDHEGMRIDGYSVRQRPYVRAVTRFFCGLVERSLTRSEEGLWSWRGERTSERALGGAVRPDGFGRYLLPAGEIIFYLELDRGTEPGGRVGDKLRRYPPALANDGKREFANVLLVCGGAARLANLARQTPAGPPWFWGTVDAQRYRLLPRGEERSFDALPALPRDPGRSVELCVGKRWRQR